MSKAVKTKWEVNRRLEEIDRRLYWTGGIGRTELMERFGISPQQASGDLKTYLGIAGDTVRFNGSLKQYVPNDSFKPIYITPDIDDYMAWSGDAGHGITVVPTPYRKIDASVLRDLTKAIHQNLSIQIFYRSLTEPEGILRSITPHSFGFNGSRYHVRAYCHHREGFRDFVLGRIIEARDFGDPGPGKERDDKWNTLIIASIGPHPGLDKNQREIIEIDYDMTDGQLQCHIKQALLLYFLEHFQLDGKEISRPAVEQQIILKNPEIRSLT